MGWLGCAICSISLKRLLHTYRNRLENGLKLIIMFAPEPAALSTTSEHTTIAVHSFTSVLAEETLYSGGPAATNRGMTTSLELSYGDSTTPKHNRDLNTPWLKPSRCRLFKPGFQSQKLCHLDMMGHVTSNIAGIYSEVCIRREEADCAVAVLQLWRAQQWLAFKPAKSNRFLAFLRP